MILQADFSGVPIHHYKFELCSVGVAVLYAYYPFGPILEFVHTLKFLFATLGGCERSVFRYSLTLVGAINHVRVMRIRFAAMAGACSIRLPTAPTDATEQ